MKRQLPPVEPDLVQGFMAWEMINPTPPEPPPPRRKRLIRKGPWRDPFT